VVINAFLAHAVDAVFGLGPAPAVERVNGGASHQTTLVSALGQLFEAQRLHAVSREFAVDPMRIFATHNVRVGLTAVRTLTPDFHGRRPQTIVEQHSRRFTGGVTEVVRRVGRRRGRSQFADPTRVAQQIVLFGLAHDVRVAAGD
jgi:hypothetical protein